MVQIQPPLPPMPREETYPWLAPFSGNTALILKGALSGGQADLQLDFQVTRLGWEADVWGYANLYDRFGQASRTFNGEDHHGRIVKEVREEGETQLTVEMTFFGSQEKETPVGLGRYVIRVKKAGEIYSGFFEGTVFGEEVRGEVIGRGVEWEEVGAGEFFKPREHPRLFIRSSGLPLLRERAQTPEGRAILERLDWVLEPKGPWKGTPGLSPPTPPPPRPNPGGQAIGHTLKFLLTGDAGEAAKAGKLIEPMLFKETFTMQDLARGEHLAQVAMVYDLCYEGWEESFRREVHDFLRREAVGVSVNIKNNPVPHGHQAAMAGAGQFLAALAVLGDAVLPTPQRKTVAPPEEFRPGEGLPVASVTGDAPVPDWLLAGPFPAGGASGFLDGWGRPGQVWPGLGTKVTVGDVTQAFHPLGKKGYFRHPRYTRDLPGFCPSEWMGTEREATFLFFSVLDVRQARVFQFQYLPEATEIWFGVPFCRVQGFLGAEGIRAGDIVTMGPGLYPFLLEVQVKRTKPGGRVFLAPRWKELTGESPAAEWNRLRTLQGWRDGSLPGDPLRYAQAAFEDQAGRGLILGYRALRRWLWSGLGQTGCGAEEAGKTYKALRLVWPALWALEKGLNRTLKAGFGGSLALVGLAARMQGPKLYGEYGEQDLSAPPLPLHDLWCLGFPLSPEPFRPALRAIFDGIWGLAGDKSFGIYTPCGCLWALLGYPFGVALRPSGDLLPPILGDMRKGFFTFRTRHGAGGDGLVMLHLGSEALEGVTAPISGPLFTLRGLGAEWGGIEFPLGPPQAFNTVVGPRALYFEVGRDGQTAALGLDTSPAYLERGLGEKGAPSFIDHGVKGFRAFGFDGTGRSGASMLMVVADRLLGSPETVWLAKWKGQTGVQEGGFWVRAENGARLDGRFLSPRKALVKVREGEVTVEGQSDGFFFCVITVQKGEPPAMEVLSQGPDFRLVLGGRTIAFDGQKVVFGQK